ncbi:MULTISPECIES: metallophosphoesterase family protein [unclassified Ensifer]|uniref:metallophosphoesterase family protein n=1 Tax=unclassified Ensifer TaxID=2633371 RepID=UPI0008133ED6|nr:MULTISPECIES: metallophosphoesterase family protein [unclassified Ensifer]OCP22000.1 hypothetical protein BC361_25890 [Ensifer sp. LC54]OCP23220.1 hypothetical protein BC363_24875 [Ensifer sp. LC384]
MKLFFTGCTHFAHANIIRLANRPFVNVDEMNEALVERWNAKVGKNDRVYHLGDVGWNSVTPWMERLNGEKVIITGNHDDPAEMRKLGHWCGVKEITNYLEIAVGGGRLVLFHYPIDDWNGRWKGSIHLHCHTHSPNFRNANLPRVDDSALSLPDNFPPDIHCNRFNVGVDANGFEPVALEEIIDAAISKGDR